MHWLKSNVLQIVSMFGAVAMLIVVSSMQLGGITHAQDDIQTEVARQKTALATTQDNVVALSSDVRVLGDRQMRLDQLVTRQEASIRRLDAIAIKLQAVIEVISND